MQTVKRFSAIEGLRAWLAWAVVADHVAYWSGFRGPLGNLLRDLGTPAVACFMIVSGFVIAHSIVERPEPYRNYLTRRFARIFPLFAIMCVAGYFAYPLPLAVDGFDAEFAAALQNIVDDTNRYFWQHVVAHATMMHGLFGDNLLPSGAYAFNMMAWTISLEWQFYLVAPLVIALLRKQPATMAVMALLVFADRWMFRHQWFGIYVQPSLLPAMADYFAIGIGCRLAYPYLAGKINLHAAFAGIVLFYMTTKHHVLALWLTVWLGLLVDRPPKIYRLMLESPPILYLGSRSYSAFLGHFLVVNGAVAVWHLAFHTAPGFVALLAMTVPATIVLSELLYRWIELPGIALGSSLCRSANIAKQRA